MFLKSYFTQYKKQVKRVNYKYCGETNPDVNFSLTTGTDGDLHDQLTSIGSSRVTLFPVRSIFNILKKKKTKTVINCLIRTVFFFFNKN